MVLELETVHHISVSSKRRGVFNLFGLFLGQNRKQCKLQNNNWCCTTRASPLSLVSASICAHSLQISSDLLQQKRVSTSGYAGKTITSHPL